MEGPKSGLRCGGFSRYAVGMQAKDKGFKVRPAEFADAQAIFEMIKRFPDSLLARPLGDIVQNIDRFLIAVAGSRLIGTVSWSVLPEIGLPRHPYIEIKSLAVEEDWQGKGVGAALIQTAINRLRPMHPQQIIALTFAPGFFAKMGFVEIPKEKLMHKIYMGCINCTRYDSPFTCPEIAMGLDVTPLETDQPAASD